VKLSDVVELHDNYRMALKRIKELEQELKAWQWKCSDALAALSAVSLAVEEYKANDAKAKAEGSRQ
jgi:hypothetical protein